MFFQGKIKFIFSVEIVGYVFERLNEKNVNRIDRERIAEEIVEECRKRWAILNRYKDANTIIKVKNDPSLDMNSKNGKIKAIIKDIYEQCKFDNAFKDQHGEFDQYYSYVLNSDQSDYFNLTGKHNIDDITCVICFFKNQ